MEDITVCKGLYAYQFRVDISGNSQSTAEIKEFLDKYLFVKYVGQFELSDKHKPHFQMCLWRETPLEPKECTKARNWWRGKTLKTKQPVSLTSAKKIKSLVSYCQKGEKQPKIGEYFQHFNNLSKEEQELIPKWETKTRHKLNKRELFKSTLKSMSDTSQICGKLDKFDFCKIVNQVYYKVYGSICFRKQVYVTALYEHNYIEDHDIINDIFKFGLP